MNEKSSVFESNFLSADQSGTDSGNQSGTIGGNQSDTDSGNQSGTTGGNQLSTVSTDQPSIIEKNIKGTIISINRAKHSEFIKRNDKMISHDIFAGEASIVTETRAKKFFLSDMCQFDLIKTARGIEAINIQILDRNIRSISQLGKIPRKTEIFSNDKPGLWEFVPVDYV